jgi:hypothetical protein
MLRAPIFAVTNHHVEDCGKPPQIDRRRARSVAPRQAAPDTAQVQTRLPIFIQIEKNARRPHPYIATTTMAATQSNTWAAAT